MLYARIDGRNYTFNDDDTITVGRLDDATIHVEDQRISRRHLLIERGADGWVVQDVGSANGTFLDGRRVTMLPVVGPLRLHLGAATGLLLELSPSGPIAQPSATGLGSRSQLAASKLGARSQIHDVSRGVIRIGRAPDNDVVVDDMLVSRYHAELRRDSSGAYEIVDLHSDNGTFVDGVRISRARIDADSIVTLGHQLFRLVGDELEEYVDTGRVTFEAVGLTVKVADNKILLDDVTFPLGECSFLAIVGPSGSGKSTLINAMTGFRPADEGQVFYAGRDLYESYEDINQRIGYVPQEDILHTDLSARTALRFAGQLRFPADVSKQQLNARIDEVLAELGLSERGDLLIRKLSGGQRKRSSIALELLTKPSLIFLDEPTSGLDPGFEKVTMQLFRSLADSGRTVVVVTHSLQSLDLCDRVLFLATGGRQAYFGPPQQALEYFGASDYADIFTRLERERDTDWKGRFRASPQWKECVVAQLQEGAAARTSGRTPQAPPPGPTRGWLRQFRTLCARYLRILASDTRNLAILALQAPLLALLILAAVKEGSLDPAARTGEALTATLVIVLAMTLMGALNSIREIVKEFPVYRRERAVGLSVGAYIGSKVAVLSAVTLVQAVILVLIATYRMDGPVAGALLASGKLELIVDVTLAGLAAMGLGLIVSSLVSSSDKAMTLLPLILIPQIILSGAVIFLHDKPAMRWLGYTMSANWGFSASASTVNLPALDELAAVSQPILFGTGIWEHTSEAWLRNIGALSLIVVLTVLGAWYLLKRRDPAVLSNAEPRKRPAARIPTVAARPAGD
ncbi:MAG: ABC transporter ATP-binding protein [Chloroflexi bacterium]|nr:MAG: ABC transporter ATP-binding protein [Chloroflexota bacterium]